MKIKKALIYLIFLLAAGSLAAQEGISVYEGARFSYRVDFHEGSRYAWQVFSQLGPPVEAVPGEFTFTGTPDWNETEIQWDLAGTYYLVVTETNPLGCSTSRSLPVQVLPNNRSVGFDVVASNACFSPGGNGFELPVSLLANNGEPLPEGHYPVNVSLMVNGVAYQQVLEYGTTVLQVSETLFAADHTQDTQVLVEITGATDRHSAALAPGSENSLHTRVIYAIPEIEFVRMMQQLKDLKNENSLVYNSARAGRRNGGGTGADNPGGG
jgi:hypothetical protein